MQRTFLSFIIVVFALPLAARAQQWSTQQQEVWDAEVACLEAGIDDIAARKACIHPDFMGWGVQSPVPTGFAGNEFDYYMTRTKLNVIEAAPLHILVEGDLAIIQLIVKDITSQDGGPDETTWVAWTDIMRRDNGAWRWIADHGHVLGDNQ